jgi:hypothetical protein
VANVVARSTVRSAWPRRPQRSRPIQSQNPWPSESARSRFVGLNPSGCCLPRPLLDGATTRLATARLVRPSPLVSTCATGLRETLRRVRALSRLGQRGAVHARQQQWLFGGDFFAYWGVFARPACNTHSDPPTVRPASSPIVYLYFTRYTRLWRISRVGLISSGLDGLGDAFGLFSDCTRIAHVGKIH